MIEILSLPRRPKENVAGLSKRKSKSALPINSLPGWEHIPLNSKLPMLKCPGNQVVFSKNKIGQSISSPKRDFDTSGSQSFPEYNPLQDSNLRTFYSNESNLKRLRENGEITQTNDVICNLKEFNQYRQLLRKSQLCYILNELNRMEKEQHDRMSIAKAEYITSCGHRNQTARQHSYNEVLVRKSLVDQQKMYRFRKLLATTEDKIANINSRQIMISAAMARKKALGQIRTKKHWDRRIDLQRKQLISLKKLFQLKNDRLRKNVIRLQESRAQKSQEKQMISWNKRLEERIANQYRIRILLQEVDHQKRDFIDSHKEQYKQKWIHIQQEIKKKALLNRKSNLLQHKKKMTKKSCPLPPPAEKRRSFCAEFHGSFDKLQDIDVCKALNAVLDLEDNNSTPFAADDPIYKAAHFIMQHILKKFHKDLSSDKVAYKSIYDRIDQFLEEAKQFVYFRSTQIISAAREAVKEGSMCSITCKNNANNDTPRLPFKHTRLGRVSFSKMSSTIGISSYEIHPLIEIREVGGRRPTPAGSLDSVVVDSTTSLSQKTQSTNLCRYELVFIEHYVTKFKRELIVGIGRRVFAAIQCHFENKIMSVRHELLEIDRKFLVKQTTKSILRYSINPLDFESNLRLCISALSSDIIWSLQKVLLKPRRDPRRPVKPHVK